jgi:DNA-binding transcriptional regulator YdaS (Cro superfamily)
MDTFQRVIQIVGSQAELARRLNVLPQHVHNWRKRRIPADRCIPIEAATGGVVTRHDLRPDIFGPAPAEPSTQEAA